MELDVRKRHGINVVGVIRGEDVQVNILPEEQFEAGDVMILIGENSVLNKFSNGSK